MAGTPDKKEILDLERKFWDTMKTKDGKTAGRMTADGSIIVGAQGVGVVNAQAMEKMMAEGKWELKQYTIDEKSVQCQFLSHDVAIVAYTANEHITVEAQALSMQVNDSSVWVRRNGAWQCALHTESLAGDPFGRDRKPKTG